MEVPECASKSETTCAKDTEEVGNLCALTGDNCNGITQRAQRPLWRKEAIARKAVVRRREGWKSDNENTREDRKGETGKEVQRIAGMHILREMGECSRRTKENHSLRTRYVEKAW